MAGGSDAQMDSGIGDYGKWRAGGSARTGRIADRARFLDHRHRKRLIRYGLALLSPKMKTAIQRFAPRGASNKAEQVGGRGIRAIHIVILFTIEFAQRDPEQSDALLGRQ